MRQKRNLLSSTAMTAVALLAAACGTSSGDTPTAPGASGFTPPKIAQLDQLGVGEGAVSVLAWPGYAEDGSNDPKIDWVTPFEKATGCATTVKTFGTSDEAVTLMKTGDYDVVSASGDASLRLIASGDVAPVNTALVPSYPDIAAFLKDKAWNSVGGQMYGIPHGWGANLLMYRTDKVSPAPTSWSAVFTDAGRYAGKVTAYDSPIYIADAALFLMRTKPELGIKNPYALDDKQLAAAVEVLRAQKANVSEYWSDYLKEVQSFKSGNSVIGTTWQVIVNTAAGEKAPVKAILPDEGSTGWSDTWMVAAKGKHPNCAYRWMDWIASAKVNAQVAEYFGEAPANEKACEQTTDKSFCDTYHAKDAAYADKIWYWSTPITQCLDGRTGVTCTDYAAWTRAWTEIKG
jgi:putative spermidine/putrescine transport system substrate-binding protein